MCVRYFVFTNYLITLVWSISMFLRIQDRQWLERKIHQGYHTLLLRSMRYQLILRTSRVILLPCRRTLNPQFIIPQSKKYTIAKCKCTSTDTLYLNWLHNLLLNRAEYISFFFYSCESDCSVVHYLLINAPNQEEQFTVCVSCFKLNRAPQDGALYKKVGGDTAGIWRKDETAALLQAVNEHRGDWDLISNSVQNKVKCLVIVFYTIHTFVLVLTIWYSFWFFRRRLSVLLIL